MMISHSITQAVEAINDDQCVVFPTETVYGLGSNALSKKAVARIFEYKNRPPTNPLIVHIADEDQLSEITTGISSLEKELFKHFSPGPLSLILPKKHIVPDNVTGGLDSIGIRIPNHPIALEFLNAVQKPICAPSANISGKPSPTSFEMATFYMRDKVPIILDGGDLDIGIESTVIKVVKGDIYILRAGFVTSEMIFDYTGIRSILNNKHFEHQSPGTNFPHYKPKAIIKVFENTEDLYNIDREDTLLLHLSQIDWEGENRYFHSISEYAHHLYAIFFESDKNNIKTIYCELPPNNHEGMALHDRLIRAANH
ncbi:MAG: L-threonylcarbamoyladenylate synthase [Brevinema sp.]